MGAPEIREDDAGRKPSDRRDHHFTEVAINVKGDGRGNVAEVLIRSFKRPPR